MRNIAKLFFILAMVVTFPNTLLASSDRPYLVFDYKSGTIYAHQKPFDRWYPASLTKLMTAYTVFKEVEKGIISLKSPVKVSAYALSQPPTKMGFPVGSRLNFDNALKIIMVKSSNDISVAIAESTAGTERRFVALMNKYAEQLGMKNSHFMNPHGLHSDDQYTSARDMGALAKAILEEFPQYKHYFDISAIKFGKKTLRNHNRLVHRLPGTNGMKTGYTCPSGLNVVVSRKHNQKNLIAIVMGMPSGKERNALAAKLLTNAENVNGNVALGMFDDFVPKQMVNDPINLRPIICAKKKKKKTTKVEYAMFYPLRNETLKEREKRYYSEDVKMDNVITVRLGDTKGPDPYALNRDPINPQKLITPLLSYSDNTVPNHPEKYLASIKEIEDVMVLSSKKFDLKKIEIPSPTANPEHEERLALARHQNISPQLSFPNSKAPNQPEHYLQSIWDADWAPIEFRPIFEMANGQSIAVPVKKPSNFPG